MFFVSVSKVLPDNLTEMTWHFADKSQLSVIGHEQSYYTRKVCLHLFQISFRFFREIAVANKASWAFDGKCNFRFWVSIKKIFRETAAAKFCYFVI